MTPASRRAAQQRMARLHYFHGSRVGLEIGRTYRAHRNEGTFGHMETLVEARRPRPAPSRLRAFFMVAYEHIPVRRTIAADIYSIGGSTQFIFEVAPVSNVAMVNLAWLPSLGFTREQVEDAYAQGPEVYDQLIDLYWDGGPWNRSVEVGITGRDARGKWAKPDEFEYLAERIRILSLVRGIDG